MSVQSESCGDVQGVCTPDPAKKEDCQLPNVLLGLSPTCGNETNTVLPLQRHRVPLKPAYPKFILKYHIQKSFFGRLKPSTGTIHSSANRFHSGKRAVTPDVVLYSSGYSANIQAPDPAIIVKRHIRLLHEYNEIKDVAQGLLGLIAEARGVRHVEVQKEFGVGGND
ncbi:hypothetical protein LOZ58_001022 [Ophidiomyces ophidiicola]|nr:hypothetical protein LOZ65_002089 [Ophidiomyces ophidiicola]KAI1966119.1 hypothetical protein LOZ58_001022 [Ophidiomyces ophidiicola]